MHENGQLVDDLVFYRKPVKLLKCWGDVIMLSGSSKLPHSGLAAEVQLLTSADRLEKRYGVFRRRYCPPLVTSGVSGALEIPLCICICFRLRSSQWSVSSKT